MFHITLNTITPHINHSSTLDIIITQHITPDISTPLTILSYDHHNTSNSWHYQTTHHTWYHYHTQHITLDITITQHTQHYHTTHHTDMHHSAYNITSRIPITTHHTPHHTTGHYHISHLKNYIILQHTMSNGIALQLDYILLVKIV